ncbi:MAG TPA: type IV pilus assembly protein PilM [Patescibacteria group bacterium]|nr:type IV pilus assembly protein PilM [Patescibacteria group bacterium]
MSVGALFYRDRPIFGLDIGFSNLKVMQLSSQKDGTIFVTGYGIASFDPAAIVEGVIKKPEVVAEAIYALFDKGLVGDITTRRAAMAIPATRTFSRSMTLPKLSQSDLSEAVRLEAEQYIPIPIDSLYLDYMVSGQTEDQTEIVAVAVSRKIVDSYLDLAKILNIEPVTIETTINAGSRLFTKSVNSDVPTVLMDFGSISTDITIFDKNLVVTGTIPGGGDSFNKTISEALGVTLQEAHIIKTKYGLGLSKKQKEVIEGLRPVLEQLLKETRRMIRYYEERSNTTQKISQVVTMGGGANMPGLSEYMTNELRLPVRMCDPWEGLNFADLQPPNSTERSMFVTVAGLALLDTKELFQ